MPFADLPFRGVRAAPTFDDSQPEELARYFTDLEDLFARHAIADLQERKQAAVRYLKCSTECLWKTADAWADAIKTYDEFKAEILKLYPGSTNDRTFTMQDLDALIGQYAWTGIRSAAELGEYHRQFLLISRYLVSKNHMATQEQSRHSSISMDSLLSWRLLSTSAFKSSFLTTTPTIHTHYLTSMRQRAMSSRAACPHLPLWCRLHTSRTQLLRHSLPRLLPTAPPRNLMRLSML